MNIYNDILEALNAKKDYINGQTDPLKEVLGDLGEQKYDLAVMAAGNGGRFQQEWLFDMLWYEPIKTPDMEYENPAEFVLVVESELSKVDEQGFREDFDKLLIANAPYRVMIFPDRKESCDIVLSYAHRAVGNCRNLRTGDTVAVILYDDMFTRDYRMKVFTKE